MIAQRAFIEVIANNAVASPTRIACTSKRTGGVRACRFANGTVVVSKRAFVESVASNAVASPTGITRTRERAGGVSAS